MKVRITAVAVIEIHESELEEVLALSTIDVFEELGNADNVFTSVQPVDDDDDESTSECAFCGEPTLPGYPICEDCYTSRESDYA